MKQKLTIFLALFVVAILAGCNGQWSRNSGGGGQGRNRPHATEDEVRQQFEKLMNGFAQRDIAAIDGMMASNATFINPQAGAGVYAWADARPLLEQAFARGAYMLSNDSAYRIGVNRDMAWIATVYHVRVPIEKTVVQSDGGVSVVFQKTEDGYKVQLFHISRFTPPPVANTEAKPASKPAKK